MNNKEFVTSNENTTSSEATKPTFTEKAKATIEIITDKIYTLRCVCCFTSLLALLGILFLFVDQMHLPGFIEYAILFLWGIGVLSGIIACPLKMICNVIALIVSGATIGFMFLAVGAIVGIVIALIICFLMVMILPSVVTIRHYFKELRYERGIK